jgi:hypothetical protein
MANVSIVNCTVIFLFVTISSPHILKYTFIFPAFPRFVFLASLYHILPQAGNFCFEKIIIHATGKSNGKWGQRVEIHYNWVSGIELRV